MVMSCDGDFRALFKLKTRVNIRVIHDDAHDDVSQHTILLPHWLWRGKTLPP